jgi:hypothetical protein
LAVLATTPAAADLTKVGTAAATNPLAEGKPPGQQKRKLLVGSDVFFQEEIVTSGSGQTQVLFNDESTLTVGANSEVVIDSYVYEPKADEGEVAMQLIEGVMRYVGGQISKGGNVRIDTPAATLGIRGGIAITSHDPESGITETSNVFGRQTLTVNGTTQVVQQGWTATVSAEGQIDFSKTDVARLQQTQQQLEGDGGGGAEEQPTEEQVAESGFDEQNSSQDPALVETTSQTVVEQTTEDDAPETGEAEDDADITENVQEQGSGGSFVEQTAFGDGRVLSTSDSSYLAYFGDIVGDPLGQNFVGGPNPEDDEAAFAAVRTSSGGESVLTVTVDGERITAPIESGEFEVDFSAEIDGGTRGFSGRGFVDDNARFAYYALERTDTAAPREIGSFDIDPEATFLRLSSSDNAPAARALPLDQLGVAPGDTLVISRRGDRTVTSTSTQEVQRGLIAVFSSSDQLAGPQQLNRVVDAIDAGFDVDTLDTLDEWPQSTDIPQDFGIPTFEGAQTVVVPDGAEYLFVATNDQFFEGNSDLDGDYGIDLATYTPGQRSFFFTGVPTPNGGQLTSAAPKVTTYRLRPEAFSGSEIPFLPPRVADRFSNPKVSPVYILRREGPLVVDTGDDVFPPQGVSRSRFMQASIGIEGKGAAQRSFLQVNETPLAASTEDKVFISSGLRGSVRLSADQPRFRISGDVGSTQSATGDHFFGDDLDYFVLNNNGIGQNDEDPDLELGAPSLVPTNFDTQVAEVFGYVHVAERSTAPSGLGNERTPNRVLRGYAAAMAQSAVFLSPQVDDVSAPYVLRGAGGRPDAVQITNHDTNTTSAVLAFDEPLEASTVDTAVFSFGGDGTTRGSFIDDRVLGARNSTTIPSTVNGNTGSGTSQFAPFGMRGAIVSSETLFDPGTELLGQETCTCEYLRWGFWSAEYRNADDTRREHVHMGTWVAGDLPSISDLQAATGTATYTGHAIGEVANAGVQYIAAGEFQKDWDFASDSGTVSIRNFDGHNLTGSVDAPNARDYGGQIFGTGLQGRVDGSFYGPADGPNGQPPETGGQFHLEGQDYRASGTFAASK